MKFAGSRRFRFQLIPLICWWLSVSGCGPSEPAGTPPKAPGEPVKEVVVSRPQANGGDSGQNKSSSNEQEPQQPNTIEFPMPDLSYLSDEVFQRNAKMGRLVAKKRCILCHKIEGRGAILQPPLVQVSMRRLKRMLDYDQYLTQLETEDPDRFTAGKKTFEAIRDEADVLKSMRLWLKGYLRQPTFDNSQAKMPLQVLTPAEIEQLASYVIQLGVEGYQKGETPLED